MWPFRRKTDDDESSYESYSSYEEYTDDEYEEKEEEDQVTEQAATDHIEEGEDDKEVEGDDSEIVEKHEEKTAVTEEPQPEVTSEAQELEQESPTKGTEDEAPIETVPEETTPKDHVTSEPVPVEEVISKESVPKPAVSSEDPVQNVVETVVSNEESIQSDKENEGSDDDLVLVASVEESEPTKSDVGLSYDTDEELQLMAVEDSFDTHEKSYDTGGESEVDDDESSEEEDDDDEEEASPLSEKQSLLALAAEHDRVDILKAILAENASEQEQLLNSPIPPLHVAVSYGSTHATSCLLRMGANPAIRPDVAEIRKSGNKADVHNLTRYDGVSAWELAFGRTVPLEIVESSFDQEKTKSEEKQEPQEAKRGWFGVFGGGSSKSMDEKADMEDRETPPGPPASTPRRSNVKPVEMAPSKREGIRHAFTAEALRCIGADEAERLQQLLDSGMPSDIDVGGKTLHGWCLEMGALGCEPLIRPAQIEKVGEIASQNEEEASGEEKPEPAQKETETPAAPEDTEPTEPAEVTGDKESLASLANRLEELESLASALATVLDNLAEEVSVCHGLLLSGGGAAALASHVRSLKNQREQRADELAHWTREWENGEDELAYWAREYGAKYNDDFPATSLSATISRKNSFSQPQNAQEEESQRRQLVAQLAASENKVRKLRASITDLSEENTRDLEEVERRSLTGGIKLVRTLRDELREVEFKLSEAKSGEAACRARVSLIQSRLDAYKKEKDVNTVMNETDDESEPKQYPHESSGETEAQPMTRDEAQPESSQTSRELPVESPPEKAAPDATKRTSEVIATGDSTALIVHQPHGRGLPVQIWDILLRIIGMGKEAVRRSAENIRGSAENVMIV